MKCVLPWYNNVFSMFSRLVFAQLSRAETRFKPLWLTGFKAKTGKTGF